MPPETIERGINLLRAFPSFSQARLFTFMNRVGSNIEKRSGLPYDVSRCYDGVGLELYVLTADEAKSVGLELPKNYIRLYNELDSLKESSRRLIPPIDDNEAKWYTYNNKLKMLGYEIGKKIKEMELSLPEFMGEVMEIIGDVSTEGYNNDEKFKQISAFNKKNALIGWVGIKSLEERDYVTRKAYKLAEKVKEQRKRLLVTIY